MQPTLTRIVTVACPVLVLYVLSWGTERERNIEVRQIDRDRTNCKTVSQFSDIIGVNRISFAASDINRSKESNANSLRLNVWTVPRRLLSKNHCMQIILGVDTHSLENLSSSSALSVLNDTRSTVPHLIELTLTLYTYNVKASTV